MVSVPDSLSAFPAGCFAGKRNAGRSGLCGLPKNLHGTTVTYSIVLVFATYLPTLPTYLPYG